MNFVTGRAIVILVAIGAALMGPSASAQQPSATAAPPLSNWQQFGCDELWSKVQKTMQMSPEQRSHVPPMTEDESTRFGACKHMVPPWRHPSPAQSAPATSPFKALPGIKLSPPPPPSPNSSSTDPPFGPFNRYLGEESSACSEEPDAPTQPLDVAADVSAYFNVEFTNGGFWIFDKVGNASCSVRRRVRLARI